MILLLSRIFSYDISFYIYKIALNNYVNEKILIYTYNLYLIIDKNLSKTNIKMSYNTIYFLLPDIKQVTDTITLLNDKYIHKYKKYQVAYDNEFKNEYNKYLQYLNNIVKDSLERDKLLVNNPHFTMFQKKIFILSNLIND